MTIQRITGDGLRKLAGLTKLQELRLDGAKIADAGLENLRGLTQLKRLYLANTNITDAGLEHLRGLSQLTNLDLDGTHVTDQGVKKLQQALPTCEIVYSDATGNSTLEEDRRVFPKAQMDEIEKALQAAVADRMAKAKAASDKGDFDAAILAYTEALQYIRNNAKAYYGRGLAYATKGGHDNCDQALADFTEAIRLDPDNASLYQARGTAYQKNGERDKAEADFARAKQLRTKKQ